MVDSWPKIDEGLLWKNEIGLQVRFWLDAWLTNEPLISATLSDVEDSIFGDR